MKSNKYFDSSQCQRTSCPLYVYQLISTNDHFWSGSVSSETEVQRDQVTYLKSLRRGMGPPEARRLNQAVSILSC